MGEIMIPHVAVLPSFVLRNGDDPPEVELKFDLEPNGSGKVETWGNWELRFLHNQLLYVASERVVRTKTRSEATSLLLPLRFAPRLFAQRAVIVLIANSLQQQQQQREATNSGEVLPRRPSRNVRAEGGMEERRTHVPVF